MGSQIFEKLPLCLQNYFKKRNTRTKKFKQKKTSKGSQSLADSWDKTNSSGRFLRPHFQNSFPSAFPETCVNCVTKCGTTKIYPVKVQILQTIFF